MMVAGLPAFQAEAGGIGGLQLGVHGETDVVCALDKYLPATCWCEVLAPPRARKHHHTGWYEERARIVEALLTHCHSRNNKLPCRLRDPTVSVLFYLAQF